MSGARGQAGREDSTGMRAGGCGGLEQDRPAAHPAIFWQSAVNLDEISPDLTAAKKSSSCSSSESNKAPRSLAPNRAPR